MRFSNLLSIWLLCCYFSPSLMRAQSVESMTLSQDQALNNALEMCANYKSYSYDTLYKYAVLADQISAKSHNLAAQQAALYYKALYACRMHQTKQFNSLMLGWDTAIATEEINNKILILKSNQLIRNNQSEQALRILYKELEAKTSDIDDIYLLEIYAALGFCYLEMEQFELSKKWLVKAIQLGGKDRYIEHKLSAANNLIPCYNYFGQSDSVRYYLDMLITNAALFNDKAMFANSYIFKSYMAMDEGKYVVAIQGVEKAIVIRKEINDIFLLMSDYALLSNLYAKIGAFDKGINIAKIGLEIADSVQQNSKQIELKNALASNYFAKGDLALAYNTITATSNLKDQFYKQLIADQISEMEVKYDLAEKEAALERQRNTLNEQRFSMILIIIFSILALLLVYLYYRNRRLKVDKIWNSKMMEEQRNATLYVVKSEEQVKNKMATILHDNIGQLLSAVKMNLSVVDEYITNGLREKQILEKTINLVDESISEIRNVSRDISPLSVLHLGLKDTLTNLFKHIDDSKIKFHLDIDDEIRSIDPEVQLAIYRIIQESISNVIKHAKASNVRISISLSLLIIKLTIADDGIGFDKNIVAKKEGLGLQNISSRVKIMRGNLVVIAELKNGTSINIEIPINNK